MVKEHVKEIYHKTGYVHIWLDNRGSKNITIGGLLFYLAIIALTLSNSLSEKNQLLLLLTIWMIFLSLIIIPIPDELMQKYKNDDPTTTKDIVISNIILCFLFFAFFSTILLVLTYPSAPTSFSLFVLIVVLAVSWTIVTIIEVIRNHTRKKVTA